MANRLGDLLQNIMQQAGQSGQFDNRLISALQGLLQGGRFQQYGGAQQQQPQYGGGGFDGLMNIFGRQRQVTPAPIAPAGPNQVQVNPQPIVQPAPQMATQSPFDFASFFQR